jgi:hypothetical protein
MKWASVMLWLTLSGCTLDGPNSSCKVTAEACDHCELECGHDGTHSGAAAVPPI